MKRGGRLVLGTRGSALAMAQVEITARLLRARFPECEIRVEQIRTSGDIRSDREAAAKESGAGVKGLFTREIEIELEAARIDVAVHSLKDLPGHISPDFVIGAVLERAMTADFLLVKPGSAPAEGGERGKSLLETLPSGAVIGTASVRREQQLLWKRPDLRVAHLRGNVPTRLRKLRDLGTYDAIILAGAGLDRLGYKPADGRMEFDRMVFPAEDLSGLFYPAIGQGAIGLECRADDEGTREILAAITHRETGLCIRAERELLRLLDGDCTLPVGARTRLAGTELMMDVIVFEEGRSLPREASARGAADAPEGVAAIVFERLYGKSK